jgi:hypothetical protein
MLNDTNHSPQKTVHTFDDNARALFSPSWKGFYICHGRFSRQHEDANTSGARRHGDVGVQSVTYHGALRRIKAQSLNLMQDHSSVWFPCDMNGFHACCDFEHRKVSTNIW